MSSHYYISPVQPFPWVVRRETLRRLHIPLCLPAGELDDQRVAILESLYILGGDDDGINRSTDSVQLPLYPGHEIKRIRSRLDNEQVHVTVGTHVVPHRRPEENDLLRLGRLHNPPDDVVQCLSIEHSSVPLQPVSAALCDWPLFKRTKGIELKYMKIDVCAQRRARFTTGWSPVLCSRHAGPRIMSGTGFDPAARGRGATQPHPTISSAAALPHWHRHISDALHNIVICSGRLADPPRGSAQPDHQPPILPLPELHESGLKLQIR